RQSIGRTCRVTAHIRTVADLSVRGPLSRSGSAIASMRAKWLLSSACYGRAEPAFTVTEHSLSRLAFGSLGLLVVFCQVGFGDPACDNSRLHDHVLRLVA